MSSSSAVMRKEFFPPALFPAPLPPVGQSQIFFSRNPVLGDISRCPAETGILFDVVSDYLNACGMGCAVLRYSPSREESPLWVTKAGTNKSVPVHWRHWKSFVVAPGDVISIHAIIKGGGSSGKNPIATILSIAVMAAAIWVSGGFGAGIAGGWFAAGSTSAMVAGAIIGIAGGLLIGALFPPQQASLRSSSMEKDAQTYAISATQNSARPYEQLPLLSGEYRFAGDYCAQAYSVFVGNTQYLYNLFLFSAGTVKLSDFRIGDTDIENYSGVELHVFEGWSGEDIPWFDQRRKEITENVSLTYNKSWIRRTTPVNTLSATHFITFPQGLVHINKNSVRRDRSVSFRIRYRERGMEEWSAARSYTRWGKATSMQRYSIVTDFPHVGEWEIEIRRTTVDTDAQNLMPGEDKGATYNASTFTAFQTAQADKCIYYKGRPYTLAALRLKASDELSGNVSTFNCFAQSYGYVPDGAGGFALELTQNPSALALYALCSPEISERPVPPEKIDAQAFTEFYDFCEKYGFTYNFYHTDGPMRGELVTEILAVGLGTITRNKALYSVAWDEPNAPYVDMCTPRTAWGYEIVKEFPAKRIDGLRIEFPNKEKEYQTDERVVYIDGVDETTAENVRQYKVTGVVTAELAYIVGRLRLAAIQLRPETHTWYTDWRSIDYKRGQKIRSVYDVSMVGSGWGEPVQYIMDDDDPGLCKGVVLDSTFEMTDGKSYILRDASKRSVKTWKILTQEGAQNIAYFEQPIPPGQAPELGRVLSMGEAERDSLELTIKEIEPQEGFTAKVTAVPSAPRILEAIDGPIPPWESHLTGNSYYDIAKPNAPYILNVRSDETCLVLNVSGLLIPRIGVAFDVFQKAGVSVTAMQAQIREKDSGEDWRGMVSVDGETREIYLSDVEQACTYQVRLRAVSSTGVASDWVEVEETVVGMATPPPDILTAYLEDEQIRIIYERPIDFAGYEVRMAWSSTATAAQSVPFGDVMYAQSPIDVSNYLAGSRAFFIYAVDMQGNRSETPAVIRVQYEGARDENVIVVVDHKADGWPGTITGGHVDQSGCIVAAENEKFWGPDAESFWSGGDEAPFWPDVSYEQLEYTVGFVIPPGVKGVAKHFLVSQIQGQVISVDYNLMDWKPFWTPRNPLFWTAGMDAEDMTMPVDESAFWPGEWVPLPDYLPVTFDYLTLRIVVAGGPVQGKICELRSEFDVPDVTETLEMVPLPAKWTVIDTAEEYRVIKYADTIIMETENLDPVEVRKRISGGKLELLPVAEDGTPTQAVVNLIIRGY